MLETLAITGVSLAAGWIWSRVFTRKVKPIVRFASPQEDAEALKEVDRFLGLSENEKTKGKQTPVIKWCGDIYGRGYHCPKCSIGWCNENGVTCCDCNALSYSHYHLHCCGTIGERKKVGCKIRFLMLAADVPDTVDPKKLIVILPKEELKEKPKSETMVEQ